MLDKSIALSKLPEFNAYTLVRLMPAYECNVYAVLSGSHRASLK